jgi:Replication initiation factor
VPIEVSIDWISVTFKGVSPDEKKWIDNYASHQIYDPTRAANGYSDASVSETGVIHMWSSSREEMGHHFVAGGTALRYILAHDGIPSTKVLIDAINARGRITRFDVAKDVKRTPVDYDAIWQELAERRYTGTVRLPSRHQSANGGYTIYLGSWRSDKFARIYNKAAEQNVDGEWHRYELVLKGKVATNLAKFLAQNNDIVALFDTVTKAMVTLDKFGLIQMFYDNDTITLALPTIEKVTDREKWIAEQVMPAVAKHYQEHPDSDAVNTLLKVLQFIKDGQYERE